MKGHQEHAVDLQHICVIWIFLHLHAGSLDCCGCNLTWFMGCVSFSYSSYMQYGICTWSSQHAFINTIEFVHRAVKLTVYHQWFWSIWSRYGNLFEVAQSISHIVNITVFQTNSLRYPIWTSAISSQDLYTEHRLKVWVYATANTVGKQFDGSQGNCLESGRRLRIICWQNCQWVNDHGELAERCSFSIRFHFYWQVLVSLSSMTTTAVHIPTQNFLLLTECTETEMKSFFLLWGTCSNLPPTLSSRLSPR